MSVADEALAHAARHIRHGICETAHLRWLISGLVLRESLSAVNSQDGAPHQVR